MFVCMIYACVCVRTCACLCVCACVYMYVFVCYENTHIYENKKDMGFVYFIEVIDT